MISTRGVIFQTYECKFDTQKCDYDTLECDFYTQNEISTLRIRFVHANFDFHKQECYFDMFECDYDTREGDYDMHECDFYTHELYLNMLRVNLN
jgi:hypothetical protein